MVTVSRKQPATISTISIEKRKPKAVERAITNYYSASLNRPSMKTKSGESFL